MFKLGELCPEAHDGVPDGTNDENGKSAIKQSSKHSSNHENKHSRSSEMGSDIPSFSCICYLFLERFHRILSLSNAAGTKCWYHPFHLPTCVLHIGDDLVIVVILSKIATII